MTLSNPSASDITLTLTTADGSATAGTDYTGTTSSVTIAAGRRPARSRWLFWTTRSTKVDETFSVSVQSVDAGTVGQHVRYADRSRINTLHTDRERLVTFVDRVVQNSHSKRAGRRSRSNRHRTRGPRVIRSRCGRTVDRSSASE